MSQSTAAEEVVLPSLGENTLARLVADLCVAVVGFASAIVTARVLGPSGKGTLSTLLFVVALLSYACSLGLGDAAIVLVRSRRATIEQAFTNSLPVTAAASVLGCLILVVAGYIADWSAIVPAVVVGGFTLVLSTWLRLLIALENALERLKLTSFIAATNAVVASGLVVVLVGVLDLEILGGALAVLGGVLSAVAIAAHDLRRRGFSLALSVSSVYLRPALRFGLPSEAAYLLVALSQRLDLLIVYALLGEAAAGRYTIALTLGQLAAAGPFALVTVSFPRLAGLPSGQDSPLVERLSRVTLVSAFGTAAILVIVIPVGVTPIFGAGFGEAVVPGLLLTLASVIWSEQWLLARAAAARGAPRLYFASFGTSLAVMILADLALIPPWGIVGAATASVLAAAAGLIVCAAALMRQDDWDLDVRRLVPSWSDVHDLMAWLKDFFVRIRIRNA